MKNLIRSKTTALITTIALLVASNTIKAQEEEQKTMVIYSFIMMDAGYNFNQIHNTNKYLAKLK